MSRRFLPLAALLFFWLSPTGAEAGDLRFSRAQLEAKWRSRIESLLGQGRVPLIDLQSSIKREDGARHLDDALSVMDKLVIALIAFEGSEDKENRKDSRYDWGYYVHEIVNRYPDRFILASNGGNNRNWAGQLDGFIRQTERQVRGGNYAIMGEFEFLHYMSGRQCDRGQTHRQVDIALDSPNGHRLFRLGAETGTPFLIHTEMEDRILGVLERMLSRYPRARVIKAHFSRPHFAKKASRFGPALARRLLSTYPNLYFDLSVNSPGGSIKCGQPVRALLWKDGGGPRDGTVKLAYRKLLGEFSTRFVAGFDYGGGRKPLAKFLKKRARNIRLILRDLPKKAQHDIG
ncbi:MAG: amidohydrolase family protein, partial [Rhodospirillales bacterium]|nr:amidohydrolase family protein [Rhodospirillales bacterium]